MSWKLILVLIMLSLIVIFTAQNYDVVSIRFLIWSFEASRAIIIFLTLAIGVVIGWALSYMRARE